MGVNSLPKTVTRQCLYFDLNPGPSAPESSTLTTQLPSHPNAYYRTLTCVIRQYSLRSVCKPNLKCLVSYTPMIQPGPQNVEMGHVTLTMPISRTVSHHNANTSRGPHRTLAIKIYPKREQLPLKVFARRPPNFD